ncbi:hypothetical protein Hanom_Chr17g01550581 [Helianthus anomalus]
MIFGSYLGFWFGSVIFSGGALGRVSGWCSGGMMVGRVMIIVECSGRDGGGVWVVVKPSGMVAVGVLRGWWCWWLFRGGGSWMVVLGFQWSDQQQHLHISKMSYKYHQFQVVWVRRWWWVFGGGGSAMVVAVVGCNAPKFECIYLPHVFT